MRHYWTPIFRDILTSSVWANDSDTRIVWFTLLLLADPEGCVPCAIPGLALAAHVPLPAVRAAVERFLAPDPDSRSEGHEGRRLKVVERGFQILNFEEHARRAQAEAEKARKRAWARAHRAPGSDTDPLHDPQSSGDVAGCSETLDASKSKSKSKSLKGEGSGAPPPVVFAPARSRFGGGEGQGMPAVFHTLDGWKLSPELRSEALIAGVPDIDERIAFVRTIPLNGVTGTTDRDGWVRAQFGRWRAWRETDAAKKSTKPWSAAPAPEPPKRPRVRGMPEWVTPEHAQLAMARGLSLKREVSAFAKGYHLTVSTLRPIDLIEPFRKHLERRADVEDARTVSAH